VAASTGNVPKRVSYSFITPSSRIARRFAGYGLDAVGQLDGDFFLATVPRRFMPNSMTTSSRVLVTLHTFAQALVIRESSQLIRVPSSPFTSAFSEALVAIVSSRVACDRRHGSKRLIL